MLHHKNKTNNFLSIRNDFSTSCFNHSSSAGLSKEQFQQPTDHFNPLIRTVPEKRIAVAAFVAVALLLSARRFQISREAERASEGGWKERKTWSIKKLIRPLNIRRTPPSRQGLLKGLFLFLLPSLLVSKNFVHVNFFTNIRYVLVVLWWWS